MPTQSEFYNHCDNGTNLTSAYSELQRTIQQLDKKAIDAYCIKHDIEGFFQPPTSSHMNGACERMIRTVRKVLTCMLTDYTTDIKTNMLHIHTSIVSSHLATRGNNKILRTPPPHISSPEEIFARLTRRTRARLRTKIILPQIIRTQSRRQNTSITTMPLL